MPGKAVSNEYKTVKKMLHFSSPGSVRAVRGLNAMVVRLYFANISYVLFDDKSSSITFKR